MQIIKFRENQKEIWNEFIAENNSEGFLQSWEWGSFQNKIGRKIWRVGIVEDKKNLEPKFHSVALIVKYDLPFGKSYLYCPRGPIVKESRIKNQESRVLDFLFSEIKKIAEKERSLFLKFDPAISCWFHSGDSPVEPECEIYIKGSTALRGLWSQRCGFKKSSNETQPKNTLILDLTKSEEELLKEMKQKTRYNIRLAEKKELRITNYELRIDNKKIFEEKFEEFWRLTEETSRRDKFKSHNKNYYWQMLESLGSYDKSNKNCHSEFSSESIDNKGLSRFQFIGQSLGKIVKSGGNRQKILKQVQNDSCGCSQKLQAKLYLAEYGNKTIAANIVLYFGDVAIYLHGASSNEYRNVMAPYLLQWRQILDAKNAGYKKYDFWGIAGNNEKENWKGITRFKKGFGGKEKNYIGAYDLVFSNIGYTIYKIVRKVKSL